MNQDHSPNGKLAIGLGLIGTISGIILMFGESWFIGLFGSIASIAVLLKGYSDYKNHKQA